MDTNHDVPVLIVGGGPVGLALATDLGWRGIRCMLVEQTDGRIFYPRGNAINSRTMEFCRRWGIADAVRDSGAPPDFPSTIIYLTSLQGFEIARIERPTHSGTTPLQTTPERPQRCNQLWFDPILRDRASSFPNVTLRYETAFESFERTADGVIAKLRDVRTGETEQVTARFLVACCGGRSMVPQALGTRWEGTPVLSYNLNIYLRIPELWKYSGKGKAAFHIFLGADGSHGTLIELDGHELWRLGVRNEDAPFDVAAIDADAIVRKYLGDGVPYEIKSALPWICRSVVGDSWQDGPVFLAGDAVHQHSPAGGFGLNTGLGDAVDLGWKLAAAVEGWAGPRLLDSYQTERKPVAERNVAQATENMLLANDPAIIRQVEQNSLAGENARKQLADDIHKEHTKIFISDGIALGYRYDSPVIWSDGSVPSAQSVMRYVPTSQPGARAPHAWIGQGCSTLDLFGRGFTLLRLRSPAAASDGLVASAADLKVPLTVADIDAPEIADLYERRMVLVRPDGHVAWRADDAPADPRTVIDTVRGVSSN